MAVFSPLAPIRLYWTGKGRVTGSVKGSVIPSERTMSRVLDVLGPADATASWRASCRSAGPSVGLSWSSACMRGWRWPTLLAITSGLGAHGDQGHPGVRPEPVDQRPGVRHGDGEAAGATSVACMVSELSMTTTVWPASAWAETSAGRKRAPITRMAARAWRASSHEGRRRCQGTAACRSRIERAPPEGAAHRASGPPGLQEIKGHDGRQREGGDAGERLEEGHWASSAASSGPPCAAPAGPAPAGAAAPRHRR